MIVSIIQLNNIIYIYIYTNRYVDCNFEGQMIIQDRFDAGSGHGWSGANCVIWNTVAHSGMVVQEPPTAQNFLCNKSNSRLKYYFNKLYSYLLIYLKK